MQERNLIFENKFLSIERYTFSITERSGLITVVIVHRTTSAKIIDDMSPEQTKNTHQSYSRWRADRTPHTTQCQIQLMQLTHFGLCSAKLNFVYLLA